MNNTFNGRRFAALWAKHYADYRRVYAIALLAMATIPALTFLLFKQVQSEGIVFAAMVLTLNIGNFCFRDYERTRNRIAAMTLPASQGEKYSFLWLNLWLCSLAVFLLLWGEAALLDTLGWIRFGGMAWLLERGDQAFLLFCAFCLLHSSVFFSKTFFPRRSLLGYVAVIAFIWLLGVFCAELPGWLGVPDAGGFRNPFNFALILSPILHSGDTFLIYGVWAIPEALHPVIMKILLLSLPVVLWVASFFRLKEWQIK